MLKNNISPDLLEDCKKKLLNPKHYGFNILPINEYFIVSRTIISRVYLINEYINYCALVKLNISKPLMYKIMEDIFGDIDGSDKIGKLGYFLKIKQGYESNRKNNLKE